MRRVGRGRRGGATRRDRGQRAFAIPRDHGRRRGAMHRDRGRGSRCDRNRDPGDPDGRSPVADRPFGHAVRGE